MGGIGGRAAAVVALAAATGMAAVAPAMATAMAVTANPADPAGAAASRGLAGGPLSRLELSATLRKLPIWSVTGTLSTLPGRPDGAARPPAAAQQRPARTTSGETTTVTRQETSGRPARPTDSFGSLGSGHISDVLTGLPLLDDVSGLLGDQARPATPATQGDLAGEALLPPDPRDEHGDHGRDEGRWGRGEHHRHGDHWGRGHRRHHHHWGRHRHHHHRWHGRHHEHGWPHHGGRH